MHLRSAQINEYHASAPAPLTAAGTAELATARDASCRKRGRDGTTYSRFHPSNYLSHHLAGIVTAAVFSDAAHIVEEIALLKTRISGAAGTTAAADPIE